MFRTWTSPASTRVCSREAWSAVSALALCKGVSSGRLGGISEGVTILVRIIIINIRLNIHTNMNIEAK